MIVDWFDRWNTYLPDKVAVEEHETGRKWSYGQLHSLGIGLARWFKVERTILKGDRVAIVAENCLEYIALLAAAQKTGIILVPLNYRLTVRELDFMLGNCEPGMVIYEEKFAEKVEATNHFKAIPKQIKLNEFSQLCEEILTEGAGLSAQPDRLISQATDDDPLFLIYTSGTTAFPKASIYTHRMLFWNSINTELRLDITSNDRSINCAPPFHTGGWNVLLTPFLHHGAYTLIMRGFDPDLVLDVLDKQEMTIFWAVPTMLKMMMDSDRYRHVSLERVRYFIVGGEAMPLPLIEEWHRKGIFIRQGYGLTEVGPNVTSLNHQDAARKIGSIGTPNFYIRTRIVNTDGDEAGVDEPGELLLSGPVVTPGYWNNPEATAEAIQEGWFRTGDMVKRDQEGFLYVVDRIKNMYISGGENVYPAEVEYLLAKHPAIDSVAIIGVPDDKWGETGMAFIVPKTGQSPDKEEIIRYCQENLAKYKVPRHIVFSDSLPKNDAGKIDRKKLRQATGGSKV